MKKLIEIFLLCITISSFTNCISTNVLRCKVEGNINDNVIIYPVKQINDKKLKNFKVNFIGVSEKLDSTVWEKVWIDKDLKPNKGIILYGQINENKRHTFLSAKKLKPKSTYKIDFNINSHWNGNGICNCKFKVDENGKIL